MRKRIPTIIRQTAESIRNLKDKDKQRYEELAETIRTDGSLEDCDSHSRGLLDILFTSKVTRARIDGCTWHSIPWWLAENYEYVLLNRIQQSIASPDMPADPFHYLKQDALSAALLVFPQLVKPLIAAVRENPEFTEEVFQALLLRNLWGNKADLSMSGGKIEKEEIQTESGNVLLVNNMDTAWEYLHSRPLHKIAIFADNVGLELLCDLTLIAILLHYYPDMSILYVVKSDPVFVSDVTIPDIRPTLDALCNLAVDGSNNDLHMR